MQFNVITAARGGNESYSTILKKRNSHLTLELEDTNEIVQPLSLCTLMTTSDVDTSLKW
jgi:hypothetical protein